jgi:hypothetical protein
MRAFATVLLTLAFVLNAQTPSNQESKAVTNPVRPFSPHQLPQPAVPSDPLELVTSDAQPVETVDQRAAATTLLLKASTLLDIRPYPYHRKTTFTSFGSTASDGAWQLEDTTMAGHHYRWTAQGPGYSVINIYGDKTLYSSQPALTLPVRLSQVRSAMWFVRPMVGPRATLRTAMGSLNGLSVECILLSNFGTAKDAGKRQNIALIKHLAR